jgi:aspartate racemase
VIPCNTAHYFYDGLAARVKVPMINIIEETVSLLVKNGVTRFGLLATEGTVRSRAYEKVCRRHGVECTVPTEDEQATVNSIIYDAIKQNIEPDLTDFLAIANRLCANGCQILVLGCTELSLLKPHLPPDLPVVDSLEVLAYQTIRACGKQPVGFDAFFREDLT